MKKFLALYMAPVTVMDEWNKMTKEDQKKGMDEWMEWAKAHKSDLVELGNPVGKNKRVTKEGVSDRRNEVGGYSIVQADSHEEAAKIFADNPHLKTPGTYVEVLEIKSM